MKIFSPVNLLSLILMALPFQTAANSYHGGTLLAMAGKDSVLLATDTRFSSHQTGPFLLGQFPRCVYRIGSRTVVGFYGLDSDARSLIEALREKLAECQDEHIYPQHITRLISDILYRSGYILSPIIVGIGLDGRPYICSTDGLGAQTNSDSFAIAGTANAGLYAVCESLYRPDLDDEELINLAEKCLKLSLQRDVLSGCNARIYTVKDGEMFIKEVSTDDV